jgi:hypothetical protein
MLCCCLIASTENVILIRYARLRKCRQNRCFYGSCQRLCPACTAQVCPIGSKIGSNPTRDHRGGTVMMRIPGFLGSAVRHTGCNITRLTAEIGAAELKREFTWTYTNAGALSFIRAWTEHLADAASADRISSREDAMSKPPSKPPPSSFPSPSLMPPNLRRPAGFLAYGATVPRGVASRRPSCRRRSRTGGHRMAVGHHRQGGGRLMVSLARGVARTPRDGRLLVPA